MITPAQSSGPIDDIVAALGRAKAVREALPSGGRVHIDRPLPFICVHQQNEGPRQAAYDIATSHASYLVSPDLAADTAILNRIIPTCTD